MWRRFYHLALGITLVSGFSFCHSIVKADLQIGGKAGLVSGGVRTLDLSTLVGRTNGIPNLYGFLDHSRAGKVSPEDENLRGFLYENNRVPASSDAASLKTFQYRRSAIQGKTISNFIINGTKYPLNPLAVRQEAGTYSQFGSAIAPGSLDLGNVPTTVTFNMEFTDGTLLYGEPTYQPKHLFNGTKPYQKLYIAGGAGLVSGGVRTLNLVLGSSAQESNAFYDYTSIPSEKGSINVADSNLIFLRYLIGNIPLSLKNKWYFIYKKSGFSGKTPSEIILNGISYNIQFNDSFSSSSNVFYETTNTILTSVVDPTSPLTFDVKFTDGTRLYGTTLDKLIWQNTAPPSITAFSVAPTSIDLDTRPTGNVTLSWTATAQNEVRTSRVYLEPQATRIGQTYVTAANTGISETITTPQPTQNQTYRLVISNDTGASHQDVNVTVQKDLAITNFRRTGFTQVPTNPLLGAYRFGFRITGYPAPNRFVFSGVHSATTDGRHLTPVSGMANTWDFEITFDLPVVSSGSLTVVATNGTTGAGSSASATIPNVAN